MRTLAIGICTVTLIVTVMRGEVSSQQGESTRAAVTGAQLYKWTKELSNWGRWGKDDDLGTLNLITPAKRKQAAALVKEGVSLSLGLDFNTPSVQDTFARISDPQAGAGNPKPFVHIMHSREFDRIETEAHVGTHIDAFGHRFSCWLPDGKELTTPGGACRPTAYNGYDPDEAVVMKEGGHARFSINVLRNGILTRAVLMDIPRLKGVPYLKQGTKIYIEDLEAWEKKAGVKVSSGDALVIRTGVAAAPQGAGGGRLDESVLPWLKQRDIAVNAADTTPSLPHFLAVNLGMINIHQLRLEALSEALAARKRWEFMLTVVPIQIPGGTGSPVNPIATF